MNEMTGTWMAVHIAQFVEDWLALRIWSTTCRGLTPVGNVENSWQFDFGHSQSGIG